MSMNDKNEVAALTASITRRAKRQVYLAHEPIELTCGYELVDELDMELTRIEWLEYAHQNDSSARLLWRSQDTTSSAQNDGGHDDDVELAEPSVGDNNNNNNNEFGLLDYITQLNASSSSDEMRLVRMEHLILLPKDGAQAPGAALARKFACRLANSRGDSLELLMPVLVVSEPAGNNRSSGTAKEQPDGDEQQAEPSWPLVRAARRAARARKSIRVAAATTAAASLGTEQQMQRALDAVAGDARAIRQAIVAALDALALESEQQTRAHAARRRAKRPLFVPVRITGVSTTIGNTNNNGDKTMRAATRHTNATQAQHKLLSTQTQQAQLGALLSSLATRYTSNQRALIDDASLDNDSNHDDDELDTLLGDTGAFEKQQQQQQHQAWQALLARLRLVWARTRRASLRAMRDNSHTLIGVAVGLLIGCLLTLSLIIAVGRAIRCDTRRRARTHKVTAAEISNPLKTSSTLGPDTGSSSLCSRDGGVCEHKNLAVECPIDAALCATDKRRQTSSALSSASGSAVSSSANHASYLPTELEPTIDYCGVPPTEQRQISFAQPINNQCYEYTTYVPASEHFAMLDADSLVCDQSTLTLSGADAALIGAATPVYLEHSARFSSMGGGGAGGDETPIASPRQKQSVTHDYCPHYCQHRPPLMPMPQFVGSSISSAASHSSSPQTSSSVVVGGGGQRAHQSQRNLNDALQLLHISINECT